MTGLPRWRSGKESACQCRRYKRHRVRSLGWEDPWRRDGYPVQYSCLENPVDRGASGLQSIGSRDLDVTEHTYTWIIHHRLFPGKFCAFEHGLYIARGYMDPKGWLIMVHRTCLQHPKLCIPTSSYVLGTAVQWLWRHTGQVSLLFWRLQSQAAVLRRFGLRNPLMFLKTIIYLD